MSGPSVGMSGASLQQYEFRNMNFNTADIEDPLVIDTWYEALPLTRNVQMPYLMVEQTNNGATAEDIEVELTIDGT